MSMILDGSNGVTFNDASLQGAAASPYVLKNRIINGDMRIDQRNAGATTAFSAATGATTYVIDRFIARSNVTSATGTFGQSTTAPAGFTNSLAVSVTTGAASGAADVAYISQRIEGFNVANLDFGKATAQTVTISFWVRSSLTGTFGGALQGASTRSYPFTYTISAANTWEQKSITIAGDTSGTWSTNNSLGMNIYINLGTGTNTSGTAGSWATADYRSATGATSVVGTSGATFYITGVQLEVGTSATPFERRLYNQELANCQRYCIKYDAGGIYQRYAVGFNYQTTQNDSVLYLPVEMRVQPTLTTTGTASNYAVYHGAGTVTACNAVPTLASAASNTKVINFNVTVASGFTAGGFGALISNNNTSSYLLLTAEL